MSRLATVEQNKFGVVVAFPPKAFINKDIFKQLVRAGFVRAACMSFNHWRAEATEESIAAAGKVVEEFNSAKPEKKQRLYPKNQFAR